MKKRKQLLWQLYPSYLLITVISLTIVTWFASGTLNSFFLTQAKDDLGARTRLVEGQISPLLATDSPNAAARMQINRICLDSGKRSGTRITVILPSGAVIGDTDGDYRTMTSHALRPEVVKALKGEAASSIRFSETLVKRMMYVAVPLVREGQILAVIRTAFPISAIDDKIRSVQLSIFLMGVFIAIVAAGISLFVSGRIISPIQAMKTGAQLFADGKLNHKLHVPESEEMGSLATAMNRMAVQLDERIRTIVRQRNELDAVLSSMVEGVIAVDEGEVILNINRSGAAILKGNRKDLTGRSIQETVRNVEFQRFVQGALAAGNPMEADIVLYHFDERILHLRSTPLRYDTEGIKGILVIMNDVTQLRKLENMRSDFAANVSHEIRTPLTAIKGFVETLQNGAIDQPDEARRFLTIIDKNVVRLNAIIENLLSLSRIEKEDEKKEIVLEKAPLIGSLNAALSACSSKISEKGVRVDLACEPTLSARIDGHLLEQAVVNLLQNAVQYSGEGGAIRVSAQTEGSEIRISVQDHGVGIAQEHLPRIFERFYRVDKARHRKLGGTGLGLAIVKHIASAHDGSITVDSLPGRGSTFTIHLPAV